MMLKIQPQHEKLSEVQFDMLPPLAQLATVPLKVLILCALSKIE